MGGGDGDGDHQRWSINVRAKSPKFSLNIKATATPHGPALKLKPGSGPPTHRRRGGGFLRSMFRRLFKRARPPSRLAGRDGSPAAAVYPASLNRIRRLAIEEPVEVWTVVLVAFALGAVAARGAIAAGASSLVTASLVVFSCLSLVLLRKYAAGRNKSDLHLILSNLLVIIVLVVSEFWDLGKHLGFFKSRVLRYLWKAMKLAV